MKLLKRTAFSLLGILLLILTIATILEKIYGTDFVNEYIYSSVPFVILWGVTAITSLLYIIKSKLHRQPVIFLLHLSLLFILAGAFTTWIYGEQGTMRVRQGEQQTSFTDSKGISHQLPFSITLNQFEITLLQRNLGSNGLYQSYFSSRQRLPPPDTGEGFHESYIFIPALSLLSIRLQ